MVRLTMGTAPRVRLYSRFWCGYCVAARRLLSTLGAEVEEISLGDKPELRREIAAENGNWPTLPMIFIDDAFVGGYRELAQLHRTGELEIVLMGAE